MKKALQSKLYALTRWIYTNGWVIPKRVSILRALFLLILLSFTANRTFASHAVASDLTYTCLGGNTYQITLTFYRDCAGIPAPNNPYINVTSASCGQSLGVTLSPIAGTGQDVTPTCPTAVTTCHGGTYTGIQQWVYTGTITLPMQCTDWTFSYLLCCRNASITTISNPGTSTIYVYATLNNTVYTCNNSPVFTSKPVPFICAGQSFCYSQGAYDADGDSLAYQMITPKQSATTTVNYLAGYSANQPINSSPPLSFDSLTGEICMTPQQLQVTVMAVLVSYYKNGTLIGTVERDMQIWVIACNNNLPWLSGINGTNVFDMNVCAGQPFCFYISSNDIDTGQTLTVTWDSTITGAAFSSVGNPHPTSTFCWTPPDSLIGTQAHCFTATVTDNACPINGSQTFTYCITVNGITVDLGPDQQISCTDLATVYATVNSPDPVTYLWNTGDTGSYIVVPVGTYWCTVTDGTCSASDTVVITSPFKPVAAFKNTVPTCLDDTTFFTDQSTSFGSTIIGWWWNFGDGSAVSNLKNPTHVYPGTGTYIVQLTVMNSLGCIDSTTDTITILPPPLAAFTFVNACQGQSVSFTDQSTDSATSWSWNFGDGGTSTTQNPVHTYATSGTYTVTLTVKNAIGCSSTISHTITPYTKPIANFTAPSVCIGGSTAFISAISVGTTAWQWNFGNGDTSIVQNPSFTYSAAGTYTVTLVETNANGCTDTITETVKVNALPVANAGADVTICSGSTGTLTASGGVTYSWMPGGGNTAAINVNPVVNTTYTVTVTDANGCSASDTTSVLVNPLPVASAGGNISICKGSSGTLTASGGGSYVWSPTGLTTPAITINPLATTTYTVVVTNADGCTASANAIVTVHNPPVASLSNATLCSGSSIVLDAGNAGASYAWSTGATTQTISVTSTGSYSVTVTDAFGCTASASCSITPAATLTVSLSNTAICQGQTLTLDAGNAGSTYIWSPNGQTTETITVSNAGTYSVTVTNVSGCSGSSSATVSVNPLPLVNFASTAPCAGDTTVFTNSSSISSGSIASYNWNFGNGTFSTQQNPSIVYASGGSYFVTLTATSAAGCIGSVVNPVTVNPLPVATFTANNQCQNSAVHFHDHSTLSSGSIVSWNWNFGNGDTSVSQSPTYQYSASGTYNVTLTVTTAAGCTNSITKSVTIYPLPVASFSAASVCDNSPMSFINSSSISSGSITSYSWSFGDGGNSGAASPNHTYGAAGSYNVTLTVTSSNGCTNTIIQPVIVNPIPVASAGANQSICSGNSATLTATGGGSYLWNTGSASPSITVNPLTNATYMVTVTSASGCSAAANVTVHVNALPVASAGPDKNICIGANATLTASGVGSYLWNNGATTMSITVNPASTTSYNVTVTNGNGCQASDTAVVNVNPLPTANAGPDQTICQGSTTTLTGSGGSSYQWNPVGSVSQTIMVNPAASTTYYLTVTSAFGCTATDTVNVVVNPAPSVSLATPVICSGVSATLDAGNPGSTYLWAPDGETTETISVSTGGNYSVTVTNAFGCTVNAQTNVTAGGNVSTNPVAKTICQGQTTTLDAGNPGYAYQWSTGEITETITVTASGSYTVTVTNPSGCSAVMVNTVNANPTPVADFVSPSNCANSLIQFTDQSSVSSGNLVAWNWNFGNGDTSVSQDPAYQYSSAGAYNVTLTVTTAAGCTQPITKPVTVYPIPTASFNAASACINAPVVFLNATSVSSGSIASQTWLFGDGGTSVQSSPNYTYSSAGLYDVTLIVTSSNGCNDTVIQPLNINPLPVANAGAGQTICSGNSATLTASGGGTYQWSTGFASQSVSVNPATNTTYTVTVTNGFGCTASDNVTVMVNPVPLVALASPIICSGVSSTLDAGNPGSAYLWSPNGETTESISVSTAGTYSVTVTNGFGCSVNAQTIVTSGGSLITNPVVSAICQGQSATLDAGNPGFSYEWSTGDTTETITVNAGGTYSVTVTAPSGCSGTAVNTVNVNPAPVVSFLAPSTCANNSIQFTDQTSISTGSLTSWNWNFGDGQTSNLQNPQHTYSGGGSYNITLNVSSDSGCSTASTLPVTINPLPSANFRTSAACVGDTSFFTDLSSISIGNIISWNWTFGDGKTSNLQNPQHIYAQPGSYNATLIVSSNNGCTDIISLPVAVNSVPVPAFTAPNVCSGTSTTFANGSAIGSGTIASYSWNFGDGATSALQQPLHQYSTSGSYTVTLTATSSMGCSQSVNSTISVISAPGASFTAQNVCQGSTVSFTDNSTGNGGSITSWLWNFNDGTTSAATSPNHLFASAGTYNVQLVVTSANGCNDTTTNPAIVYPIPDADFTFTNVCQNSQNVFNNTSTIPTGNIISYFWTFGDGSNSLSSNPQHIYSAATTYDVVLIAVSDHGCIDTTGNNVTVFPTPSVDFSGADVCLSSSTQFNNLTIITGGGTFTSSWNFGDTGTSNVLNPSHSFSSGGTYNVTLIATSANGCTDSITKPVNVYLPPVAAFLTKNNCFGNATVLNDSSSCPDGTIVGWEWNFGDSSSAVRSKNATHTYSSVGEYKISLAVTSNYGCSNSVKNPLVIYPLPSPAVTAPGVCEGAPVSFVNSGDTSSGSTVVSSQWNFGDGSISDSLTATHIYTAYGAFNVSLQTINQYGCKKSVLSAVDVYPQPNTGFSASGGCLKTPVTFENNSTIPSGNIASYSWNFGNNIGSSTQDNPGYSYPFAGTFIVTLNAVSDHGCARSTQDTITIYPLPVVSFNGLAKGCSPLNATLTDSSKINSGNIVNWLWNFGDGDVSTDQNPTHIYTQPGNYIVTLTVNSDKGCTASAQGTEYMEVLTSAKADFTMNSTTITMINPVVDFTNLSSNFNTLMWDFGDGDTSNVLSPSHRYDKPGDYTIVLTVNNSNNCPDRTMRRMDISAHSNLYAPNAFTPNGDGINDVWQPVYMDMTDIKVWIYNRWGEMLTSWDNLNGYWDGNYKGKPVQEDVYVYQIQGTGVDGNIYKWTGDITVVR